MKVCLLCLVPALKCKIDHRDPNIYKDINGIQEIPFELCIYCNLKENFPDVYKTLKDPVCCCDTVNTKQCNYCSYPITDKRNPLYYRHPNDGCYCRICWP